MRNSDIVAFMWMIVIGMLFMIGAIDFRGGSNSESFTIDSTVVDTVGYRDLEDAVNYFDSIDNSISMPLSNDSL